MKDIHKVLVIRDYWWIVIKTSRKHFFINYQSSYTIDKQTENKKNIGITKKMIGTLGMYMKLDLSGLCYLRDVLYLNSRRFPKRKSCKIELYRTFSNVSKNPGVLLSFQPWKTLYRDNTAVRVRGFFFSGRVGIDYRTTMMNGTTIFHLELLIMECRQMLNWIYFV